MKTALTAAVLAALATAANAGTVNYFNDFESGDTAGWNTSLVETAPSGETFLGRFSNGSVTYSASGLSVTPGEWMHLEFDLYIINTMDGDEPFTLTINGAGPYMNTTFANNSRKLQAYPDLFGSAIEAPHTGAIATNTLGYPTHYAIDMGDSTYRVGFDFQQWSPDLSFTITAAGQFGLADESWGIDNVSITSVVPTPGSVAMLGLGGLMAARRRRA